VNGSGAADFEHPYGGPAAHSSEHALWLEIATAGLWAPARTMIAEETKQHLAAAEAVGRTPEQALAQLGDPRESAAAYQQVHLLENQVAFLQNPLFSPATAHSWRYMLIRALPMLPAAGVFTFLFAHSLTSLLSSHHLPATPSAYGYLTGFFACILPLIVYLACLPVLRHRPGTLDTARRLENLANTCFLTQMSVFFIGVVLTIIDGVSSICGCSGIVLLRRLDPADSTLPLVMLLLLLLVSWALILIDRDRVSVLNRARTLYGLQDDEMLALSAPPATA